MTDLRRRGLSDQWDYENMEIDSGEESDDTLAAEDPTYPEVEVKEPGSDEEDSDDDESIDYPDEWEEVDEEEPVWKWELVVSYDDIEQGEIEDALLDFCGRYEIEYHDEGAYIRATHQFGIVLTYVWPKEKSWSTRIDD